MKKETNILEYRKRALNAFSNLEQFNYGEFMVQDPLNAIETARVMASAWSKSIEDQPAYLSLIQSFIIVIARSFWQEHTGNSLKILEPPVESKLQDLDFTTQQLGKAI